MITPLQIFETYSERKKKASPWMSKAMEVRDIYNDDFVLPLPEMDREELPAVANLAYQGIEMMAMRMASTMPVPYYPPLRAGFAVQEDAARDRKLVNLAWWDKNNLQLKLQKRFRYFTAYAATPVMVRPDFDKQCPYWHVRNPLAAFPSDMQDGEVYPDDCVFPFKRTLGWLKMYYPDVVPQIRKKTQPTDQDMFEVLEWTDKNEYVIVVVGEAQDGWEIGGSPEGRVVELERIPNRTGRCWATYPARITLDRAKGQFDGIVGMYVTQAMLMALEVIGMKRGVIAERWLESTVAGETGKIVTMADPMKGIVGVTEGGKVIVTRTDPSILTTQIVDRLEHYIRATTSMPAEIGGEGGSNIRTGRRGDAIMAASIDFPVQMGQQIMEKSLQVENEIAIAIDREFFPNKKSFAVSATKGRIEYTARELWVDDTNFVTYSHAGTDVNSLVVAGLQRVGSGTMSKASFMKMDPMVEDEDAEHDQIVFEGLELAMITNLQEHSKDPAFAPILSKIAMMVRQDKVDVLEAYQIIDDEMKKQQAGLAQAPPEAGQPGAADPAAIAQPTPSVDNLTQLLGSLKSQSNAQVA